MIGQILATIPFIYLILIYLGLFRLKEKTKITAIAVAILGIAVWIPVRHMYFLSKWSSTDPPPMSVGKTVYHCLGYWGWHDEDNLKDLFFLDVGLSRALHAHENPYIRYKSAVVLGLRSKVGDQRALMSALDDSNFYVRLASAIVIWKHNSPNVTYMDITHLPTEASLAKYMGIVELPSVPYGDEHKDVWSGFIMKVKQDFGAVIKKKG